MRLQLLLIASLACMMWDGAAAHADEAPFTITISTASPTVKSGSNVFVKIEMTNTSDHDVDCTKVYTVSGVDTRYHYELRDSFKILVGKRVRNHPEIGESGSVYPCTLGAGQSTPANDRRISSLFDM